MVKSKIVYILLILTLIAALCAASVSADSNPLPIYSSEIVTDFRGYWNGQTLTPGSTDGISAYWFSAQQTPLLFSFGKKAVDAETNGNYIYIQPDYSYTLTLIFSFDVYPSTSSLGAWNNDQQAYISDMSDVYVPYIDSLIADNAICPMIISGNSPGSFYTGITDYTSALGVYTVGINSSGQYQWGLRYTFSVDVVLHTPSDMIEDYYNAIGFSHLLTDPDPLDTGNELITYYYRLLVNDFHYHGVYDESREIFDSETDRIIEGQRQAILEGQQNELNSASDAGLGAQDDASSAAQSALDSSSILGSLRTLYNTIGYEGTDFNFTFPAAHNVPYVGDLWDEQTIPFQYYIDILPQPIRSALVIIIFVGGIAWAIHIFRSLLSIINGGKE